MIFSMKRISTALGFLAATTVAPALAQTSSNQTTADAVANALRSSKAQSASRIAIEAREGFVTLTGTVANPAIKADALARAGRVAGVSAVADRIRVAGDGRVMPAQYQPQRMAMGGRHGHGGTVTDGMPMQGGSTEGMVMDGGSAAPAMDGPMPEGPAGMTGPAQASTPSAPNYAWPSYAPHPNFSAVGYPTAYPWQAWPNIGPFYPYPEVPLDWRAVTLRWDDGIWWLDFRKHYTRPFFTPYPFGIFGY